MGGEGGESLRRRGDGARARRGLDGRPRKGTCYSGAGPRDRRPASGATVRSRAGALGRGRGDRPRVRVRVTAEGGWARGGGDRGRSRGVGASRGPAGAGRAGGFAS